MLSAAALRRLTALSLTLVCACARTTDSTETGNPPVIDVARIALVDEDGEVHVVGEPKAIRPGGGRLEVTTESSGDVARGDVDDDGSFDVAVDGTLDDQYQLRAIGAKASSEPVSIDRDEVIDAPDGGAGAAADAGPARDRDAICSDLAQLIGDRINAVEQSASETCDSNDDCAAVNPSNLCPYNFCRGGVVAAYSSLSEVRSALDAIGASLCETDDCHFGVEAECGPAPPIGCVEAQCTRCEGAACPETSCDTCDTPLVTWSTRGSEGPGASGSTFTLENCRTLRVANVGGQQGCSRTLPCVPRNASDFDYTAAHLQNALGHPDVQAALAAGTTFGALTPGGFGFSLSVGDAAIFVGATGCDGAAAPCTDEPDAVAFLHRVLENIAVPAPCDTDTPLAAECSLDFDRGTGSASEQAYAFNALIGTCVPEVYSGADGNANRFDTIDACRASCPTTAAVDACPFDRVFVEEACLECGFVGGCPSVAPICGWPCTDGSDCQDEFGTCGPDGVCAASGCI